MNSTTSPALTADQHVTLHRLVCGRHGSVAVRDAGVVIYDDGPRVRVCLTRDGRERTVPRHTLTEGWGS